MSKYAFAGLLLILAYFSYLIVEPFLSYLLFSAVLAMLFHPVYMWLHKKTNRPRLSSIILVLGLILLLILPSILIGIVLIRQAPAAYASFAGSIDAGPVQEILQQYIGPDVSINAWITESTQRFSQYVLRSAPAFLSSATEVALGLFVMFFVMFYLFTQADHILKRLRKISPLSHTHHNKLVSSIDQVVHGIIEGQVVLGLLQGLIGGAMFWALGIPNALFWGFVMAVLSIIPFLGSFIIWLPAAIWLLITGNVVKGIILLTVGFLIISQIDNFLRPYLVSRYAEVHPALVLVGVIGGLAAFGVVGFVVGPLVLALFVEFLKLYKADVVSK